MSCDPVIGGVRVDVVEAARRLSLAGDEPRPTPHWDPAPPEDDREEDGCEFVDALLAAVHAALDVCFIAGAPEDVKPGMAMVVPVPKRDGAAKLVAMLCARLTGREWETRLYESGLEYLITVHLRPVAEPGA